MQSRSNATQHQGKCNHWSDKQWLNDAYFCDTSCSKPCWSFVFELEYEWKPRKTLPLYLLPCIADTWCLTSTTAIYPSCSSNFPLFLKYWNGTVWNTRQYLCCVSRLWNKHLQCIVKLLCIMTKWILVKAFSQNSSQFFTVKNIISFMNNVV